MQAIIIVPEVVRLVCQRKPRPSVWLSKGRFARAGSREPNADRGFHWVRITLLKHPQQELPAPRHLAGEKTCAACLCPPTPVGANEHKGLRAVYGDTRLCERLDNRTSLILFRHPGVNALVQCGILYDVTRAHRTVVNCYE